MRNNIDLCVTLHHCGHLRETGIRKSRAQSRAPRRRLIAILRDSEIRCRFSPAPFRCFDVPSRFLIALWSTVHLSAVRNELGLTCLRKTTWIESAKRVTIKIASIKNVVKVFTMTLTSVVCWMGNMRPSVNYGRCLHYVWLHRIQLYRTIVSSTIEEHFVT